MTKKQLTYSPVDNSLYVERKILTEDQMLASLECAKQAQEQWKGLALCERQRICLEAVENIENKKYKIAEELCWQMGRPIRYAEGEVASCAARARHMVSISSKCLEPIQTSDKPGFTRYIKKCPVGVVLVIAPWNYPLHTPINAIIPALLAGNSVILKHSAQTPLCGERIVEAFENAGLPKGVLQNLILDHGLTKLLAQQESIQAVTFTGSVAGGAEIERACAGRFINVGLELGGKDPAYIRADADIDYAVESTVDGVCFNSGQSCCGLERIYVDSDIYQVFLDKFIGLMKNYVLGRSDDSNTMLGPVVRASAAEHIRAQITEAIEAGASAQVDPTLFPLDQPGSSYIAPQVLTNVDHSMRIMREETFGPVVGIMSVDSDEEAIRLMNDSDLGLSAAIYTQDIELAAHLGDQIETGTVFVNRCDFLDPELVWTGVKHTGRGYSLSIKGFDNFTQLKSYHIKHL